MRTKRRLCSGSAFAVVLGWLVAGGAAARGAPPAGDLDSPHLVERLDAVRALVTDPGNAERLAKAFESEPRSVDWRSGQPSVRLEIVAGLSACPEEQRRSLLLRLLQTEMQAAREDLASGYVQSPLFAVVLRTISREVARCGDAEARAALQRLVADPEGRLPREPVCEAQASLFMLEDRIAGRTGVRERVQRGVKHLTGRYSSPKDRRGVRGLTTEARKDYGAQIYLSALGLSASRELLSVAGDRKVAQPRRAAVAYVLAFTLSRTHVQPAASTDRQIASGHVARLADLLHGPITSKAGYYVDDASDLLKQVPEGRLTPEARSAINVMNQRLILSERQMTRKELAAKVLRDRRSVTTEAPPEPSARAKTLIAQMPDHAMTGFRKEWKAYLLDKEPAVRREAVLHIRRAAANRETLKVLRASVKELLPLFSEVRGDVSAVADLAVLAAQLSVGDGGEEAGRQLVDALRGSREPTLRVAATMIVRLAHKKELLDALKPLLSDENSWVRRSAEEVYKEMGWLVWRGEIVEKALEHVAVGLDPEDRQEAFREHLAAAATALKEKEKDGLDAPLQKLSTRDAVPFLLEVVTGSKDKDEQTRVALLALARIGTEAAVAPLLAEVRRSNSDEFVAEVAGAFSELNNPDAIPVLVEAVFDGTDARLGYACNDAILRMPGQEEIGLVLRAYRTRSPQAYRLLVGAARRAKSERVAQACISGLTSIGPREGLHVLFGLAGDAEIAARPARMSAVHNAIRATVGDHREEKVIVEVAIQHLKSTLPRVRLAAVQALAAIKDVPAALAALKAALRTESDENVAAAIKDAIRNTKTTGERSG